MSDSPVPGRCVLIVDDDESIRDALCEVVEMAGCSALLAANGAEALRVLATNRPCLIILDLMMPVMSGEEFLVELRKVPALASLAVVVSSSAPSRAPPGLPVLAKPVDIKALWAHVRTACRCDAQPVLS